jgi:hypothetical protein
MGRLASFLLSLRDVVLSWLLPYSWLTALPYPTILKPILVILLAVALGGLIVVTILRVRERAPQRWLDDGRMRFGLAILVFAIIYAGTAGLVFLFTYPPITVDNRMFSPVHLAIIILFSDVVHLVSSSGSRGWLTLVSVGLIVGMTASFTLRGPRIVLQLHRDGLGYTSPAWQESETIQAVRGLSPDVAIITNEVTAVLFLTGRSAYPLAEIYQSRPLARYTRYGDDTSDNTQKVFRERGAALVLFGTIEGQLRELYGDRTGERLRVLTKGLFEYFRGRDGAIYRYSPPPEGP